MTRLMLPALMFATPAMAHEAGHVHAHGTDYTNLGLGLALITLAAVGLSATRSK
ncbi:peptidase M23 [Ruegeria sp. 2205SS24-7]|uniref:peptidase M23 n=1 Tax=Ruegeria discodermiae TaxID=3064389 RepID=UPI002740A090|nr:peptidase M23 [Ruegeria sp. 2205SS24-7]MDP5219161.1 peptidase M23 [Ruegeria sp. 2205SS24-7]